MKARNSNIELLRIISMMMIISLHFWGHCVDISNVEMFSFTYFFGWFFRGLSHVAVNVYVLISAYFLCKSSFKFNKLIKLILEVWFYSVLIYALCCITGKTTPSFGGILHAGLPILFGEYWFATIYVGMYIISPFLNKALSAFDKKEMGRLIWVLLLLFSLIPNILFYSKWLNFGEGYGIVWFVVLYSIGTYIREYVNIEELRKNKRELYSLCALFLFLPVISKALIAAVTTLIIGHQVASGAFFLNNSVIILPASVLVLLTFLSLGIRSEGGVFSKCVNFIAGSCFAVYLIHDNNRVRNDLWDFVYSHLDVNSLNIVWQYFSWIIVIFVICVLIDLFRRLLFWSVNSISNRIFTWKKK